MCASMFKPRALRLAAQALRCWKPFGSGFRASNARLLSAAAQQPLERIASLDQAEERYGSVASFGDYDVVNRKRVDEFSMYVLELKHRGTGARHVHVARPDSNNSFNVSFATIPSDSTGVAHILEHLALCGSEKYPCRDPFFKMLTRSLASFMNAMTSLDHTMYPFSATNPTDFTNLLSIYLDAAFFPRLALADFRQEGWRLEREDLDDASSDWIFKGVVFNEMKGALSSIDALFYYTSINNLHPNTTYSNISGGVPIDILDLTWDQLKDFHSTHYHPSNANFLTYGDMPVESHLETISARVLSRFSASSAVEGVREVPNPWSKPKQVVVSGPFDSMAPDTTKQTRMSVGYLLSTDDAYSMFLRRFVTTLLVDGTNSPFYLALINSGLGADYSPNTGMTTATQQPSFAVGVQGIASSDVAECERVILETFKKCAETGFPKEQVDGLIHQMELSQRKDSPSFGLSLLTNLSEGLTHNRDAVELLSGAEFLARLKEELKQNPCLLHQVVQECFVDNSHRLTFVMEPSETYTADEQKVENNKLQKVLASLNETDLEELHVQNLELKASQETAEDLSCLPILDVASIERHSQYFPISNVANDNNPVSTFTSLQPTNGLAFFRGAIDTSNVPLELIPYLPTFAMMVQSAGTHDRDFAEFATELRNVCGGFSVSSNIARHHDHRGAAVQSLRFSTHCLAENAERTMGLVADVFNTARLTDKQHLMNMLRLSASEGSSSIAQSGHAFAMGLASSGLHAPGMLSELHDGITQVQFLQRLAAQEDTIQDVMDKLVLLKEHLLSAENLRLLVTADESVLDTALQAAEAFSKTIKTNSEPMTGVPAVVGLEDSAAAKKLLPFSSSKSVAISTPFSVSFASMAVDAVPYTHPDAAPLSLAAAAMSAKYLHREIREKGGAYGGGASYGGGAVSFFSYRDPSPLNSLLAMNKACDWLCSGKVNSDMLHEATLSRFQKIDAPVAPSERGISEFMLGLNPEQRQQFRERLLDATPSDVERVAKQYLSPTAMQKAPKAVITDDATAQELSTKGFSVHTLN
eukprot:m.79418 g.79418  ORF g.79418 m.79418 type:complete len:1043 (+) comp12566_c1_seq5:157-3285(+)